METTDNSLKEMQQQMQLLKDKLEKQTIVNEQMMRKAVSKGINTLRSKARIPYFAGLAAILCTPSFYNLGCSLAFLIYSEAMILFCMAATVYTNRHIPNMEDNLVNAASQLTRFKQIHADWLKIGMPLLLVWISWLTIDLFSRVDMATAELYALMAGLGVGLLIGLLAGFKVRREMMDGAEELIAQINDLQDQR